MKKALATLAILTLATIAVRADTLADWTFEGTINDTTATDFAYGPADSGVHAAGSAGGGHHAATNTVWSGITGNGSPQALSANHWAVGDYFQFSLSTIGDNSLTVSFDATGSNTGPRDFILQYSTTGVTFTDFANYSITNDNWATGGTPKSISTQSFNLSAITSLNNLST